jgi:lysyl-tRNA synthetase class 2
MWQPSAPLEALRLRAAILQKIRNFFAGKGVVEVETPLLSHATVTDPHISSIQAKHAEEAVYLQTSPEYAMKRLLAAGSGSIFQICKAFRQGDIGTFHNPEFTLLEWYRIGFDHHALMDEMDELLSMVLGTKPALRLTCQEAYQNYVGIDPHSATLYDLKNAARDKINFTGELASPNDWLDLLFTHCIEPVFAMNRPVFLYDFPVTQAALAKIRNDKPPVASRFEVYFKGIELANGFHELQDAVEQRNRFENDLRHRAALGLPLVPIDKHLLEALNFGLPECAGVALGLDRLIMLAGNFQKIDDVISFVFTRA